MQGWGHCSGPGGVTQHSCGWAAAPTHPKLPQPRLQKSSLHVVLRFGGNQRQKEVQAGSAGAREGKQTLWLFSLVFLREL